MHTARSTSGSAPQVAVSTAAQLLDRATTLRGPLAGGRNTTVTTWSLAVPAKPGEVPWHRASRGIRTQSPAWANGRSTFASVPRKVGSAGGTMLQQASATAFHTTASATDAATNQGDRQR